MSKQSVMRNEFLDDLSTYVERALVGLGIGEGMAATAGELVVDDLVIYWGGQNICFPRDHHRKLSERNRRIMSEFTGKNQSDLARKYDLTVSAIYRVIQKHKKQQQQRSAARDL